MSTLILALLLTEATLTIGHLSCSKARKIVDSMHLLLDSTKQGCNQEDHPFVAFDVSLMPHFTAKRNGDIVMFNRINVNVGEAYKDGKFLCPFDGVYEFSWTALCPPGADGETEIFLNGVVKRLSHNYERTNRAHKLATNSIIFKLKKDDEVWIGLWKKGQKLYGGGHTNFQGKLLKAKRGKN